MSAGEFLSKINPWAKPAKIVSVFRLTQPSMREVKQVAAPLVKSNLQFVR
jgi:hypothetical protein